MYQCQTPEDELNALKELSQEIVLYGLSKTDFFAHASFQGGACLRIIHRMNRFSEDLDFSLKKPNAKFDLNIYLKKIQEVMKVYGYDMEFLEKDCVDNNVRSRTLKDNSILKQLDLQYSHHTNRKIKIKLEIDTNPPSHARYEPHYVEFPTDFLIMTHDRPSLFAGKCHALLERGHIKGRDWYDYIWYIGQKVEMNLPMLESALEQSSDRKHQITKSQLKKKLLKKIKTINWANAKRDVEKFLRPEDKDALDLWGEDFFIKKTETFFQF